MVGAVPKKADGSCVIRYGDTMVLCAAVGASSPREGIDFFPLTVEYREANYAAGRIPGNYFRREGRPMEKEPWPSRLIDRPCRPLFTEGFRNETQVIATVISADPDNNPDVIAITGASCALYLSDIPFMNPIAGVRIGLIEGRYIVNPTYDEVRESRLNLIVAGTEEAIVMVEAGASEVSEEIMLEALMLAHKEINRLCRWQKELYKALDIQKREVVSPQLNEEMLGEIQRNYSDRLRAALDSTNQEKRDSYAAVDALKKEVVEGYPEDEPEKRQMAKKVFDHLKETVFRDDILNSRRRPDGRRDRKSTRLNSSHLEISYADFCLKKKSAGHVYGHVASSTTPQISGTVDATVRRSFRGSAKLDHFTLIAQIPLCVWTSASSLVRDVRLFYPAL